MKWRQVFPWLFFALLLTIPCASSSQSRDPAKIRKVAILPFLIHSQENLDYLREGIYDILSSRITVEGKITVVERSIVERALYEEKPMRLDETVAKNIGMRAGADYIVLGSLTKIGDYISLDARLISITEEKPPLTAYTQHKGIEDVMLKIGDFAQDIGYKILGRRAVAGRPTEPRHPYIVKPKREIGRTSPEGIAFKKSQTFNFEIKGLDIGDVDGDKKNEIVIMDRNNLYVFKYDGERLSLLQKIEAGSHHNFLTLDVVDVNRNGYAEVIVTSVVEDDLRSLILEYEEGKLKKITEKEGWYFRVLEHPKEGPILMGQKMGSEGIFVGPIYKFIWAKKSFEKGPKMDFPKGTNIFGFTLADIRQSGKPEILLLDEKFNQLKILSQDGKELWRSRERYGGTNNYYETSKKKADAFRPTDSPPWRVYIPSRILVRDLYGDGVKQVIMNKNYSSWGTFERLRTFDSGEIQCLVWEEDGLVSEWKTKELKGYISDYQLRDADNDGEEELVVALINYSESNILGSKGNSQILFFKLF
ncbi:MAG: VCBS repeat-containing protein [Syntrophaceae bacterium]|nr:VCBS repeat-containing protein [Syntrophaceae bacterium]